MTSRRTKISPKTGRGLGHMTPTIFGSTVGYPSDSLASCLSSASKIYCLRPRGLICENLALFNMTVCMSSDLRATDLARRYYNIPIPWHAGSYAQSATSCIIGLNSIILNRAIKIVHTAPWPHCPNENLFSDRWNSLYGVGWKTVPYVRVPNLRMLCRRRCCMSASQCTFGSLWNVVVANDHPCTGHPHAHGLQNIASVGDVNYHKRDLLICPLTEWAWVVTRQCNPFIVRPMLRNLICSTQGLSFVCILWRKHNLMLHG